MYDTNESALKLELSTKTVLSRADTGHNAAETEEIGRKKKAEWETYSFQFFSPLMHHLFHCECHSSAATNLISGEYLKSIFMS